MAALISQTEKYVHDETSERARKLEIKEFSTANFIPLVSPDKIDPHFKGEESVGEPEDIFPTEANIELEGESEEKSTTTESFREFEEKNSEESPNTEAGELVTLGWEETQSPHTIEYQDNGYEDEARTESLDLEMTTEFVEEFHAQIPTMKKLGEELLPYEGVVYYPEENEVEQTTDAIFIPNGEKEFLEVLPSKEQNASDSNFQSDLSLETTTEMSDNYNDYLEEETTVPPEFPEKENETKNKSIFPFVTTSYSIFRPIATYGLDLLF